MFIAIVAIVVSYLVGAIPFGWLIARSRGVDIFKLGSGNIGATNVGRVLGRKFGLTVFALDFAKGAIPSAASGLLPSESHAVFGLPDALRVGCALAAFLGHLFPVYLGFRGGKGAATGLGIVMVLVPLPAILAAITLISLLAAFRTVSIGSIGAVFMLWIARLLSVSSPFGRESVVLTSLCLFGGGLLVLKHRANIRRILAGTENRMEDKPMFQVMARAIHVLALGLWFGSAVMFNLIVAPILFFEAFPAVVASAPSDRTAYLDITREANDEQKKNLATSLAGSAVGPVFPKFFALQGACAAFALITALSWWKWPGKVHRARVVLILLAGITVGVGWPISQKVSALRIERFNPDAVIAAAAKADFGTWHNYSLGLSMLTLLLTTLALALASRMPSAPNGTISA